MHNRAERKEGLLTERRLALQDSRRRRSGNSTVSTFSDSSVLMSLKLSLKLVKIQSYLHTECKTTMCPHALRIHNHGKVTPLPPCLPAVCAFSPSACSERRHTCLWGPQVRIMIKSRETPLPPAPGHCEVLIFCKLRAMWTVSLGKRHKRLSLPKSGPGPRDKGRVTGHGQSGSWAGRGTECRILARLSSPVQDTGAYNGFYFLLETVTK